MNSIDRPSRCCSPRSRFTTWAWIDTSSAETGSSATSEFRLERQGAGDADALALPAREFVGVAIERILRQLHLGQRRPHPLAPCRARPDALDAQPLRQDLAYRHAGREARERVLEYVLHPGRIRRSAAPPSLVTSSPSNVTLPALGSTRRSTARAIVVLPLPDSPTRPTTSPRPMSKEMSSMIRTGP